MSVSILATRWHHHLGSVLCPCITSHSCQECLCLYQPLSQGHTYTHTYQWQDGLKCCNQSFDIPPGAHIAFILFHWASLCGVQRRDINCRFRRMLQHIIPIPYIHQIHIQMLQCSFLSAVVTGKDFRASQAIVLCSTSAKWVLSVPVDLIAYGDEQNIILDMAKHKRFSLVSCMFRTFCHSWEWACFKLEDEDVSVLSKENFISCLALILVHEGYFHLMNSLWAKNILLLDDTFLV